MSEFKCVVELYGFTREITTLSTVEVRLEDGAAMAEVIAALRKEIPALDECAFRSDENRLADLYKFNVNGRLYYDGMDFLLHDGDRVALLTLVTGG
jgi:molybdopterin converting factor small subunit